MFGDLAVVKKTECIEKHGVSFQAAVKWGPKGAVHFICYQGQRLFSPSKRRLYRFYNRSFDRFWKSVAQNQWESETFSIFKKYLRPTHSYIDIGAWIGPTVLFGSQLAKHCWALEPDPVAFRLLQTNLQLNAHLAHKVTPLNVCFGAIDGKVKFGRHHSIGGDSRSSLIWDKAPFWWVDSVTIETLFRDNQIWDCNFIKMDIEGGEIIALPAMAHFLHTTKPTLFLSLHPLFFPDPEKNKKMMLEILLQFPFIFDKFGNPLKRAQLETWNYDCIIATYSHDDDSCTHTYPKT
jgi:FkbM family methyltransferase